MITCELYEIPTDDDRFVAKLRYWEVLWWPLSDTETLEVNVHIERELVVQKSLLFIRCDRSTAFPGRKESYILECLRDVGVWMKPAQFFLDVYRLLQVAHAGSHCSISSHRWVSYPSASCCLCLLYAGWCEQVETERQNEWAAEAAARWTREISWEIDTDKSHTLRLPGRQLSVEEAAGTVSHKWHWVSLILCLQHVAARSESRTTPSSTARKIRKPGALADISFD